MGRPPGAAPALDRLRRRLGSVLAADLREAGGHRGRVELPRPAPAARRGREDRLLGHAPEHRAVGTPQKPLDPAGSSTRPTASTARGRLVGLRDPPVIALNELFGAGTAHALVGLQHAVPRNVLTLLRRLSTLGARPYLLSQARPTRAVTRRSGGATPRRSPTSCARSTSPGRGSRTGRRCSAAGRCATRCATRSTSSRSIGIPPSRPRRDARLPHDARVGSGARGCSRERLVRRVEARGARRPPGRGQERAGSVWSWGWGVWSKGETDPDKEAAACVWLWARDRVAL